MDTIEELGERGFGRCTSLETYWQRPVWVAGKSRTLAIRILRPAVGLNRWMVPQFRTRNKQTSPPSYPPLYGSFFLIWGGLTIPLCHNQFLTITMWLQGTVGATHTLDHKQSNKRYHIYASKHIGQTAVSL